MLAKNGGAPARCRVASAPVQSKLRSRVFRRCRIRWILAGTHVVIAADFGEGDIPQQASIDHLFFGFDQMRCAAALGSHLNHTTGTSGGIEHRLALEHVHARRLLHIDIGASLHRRDHWQRMPVIGSRNQHDVEILLRQHVLVIGVRSRTLLGNLAALKQVSRLVEHPRVHVTEGNHFDRFHVHQLQQVALAVPSRSNQPDASRFRSRGGVGLGMKCGDRCDSGGTLNETSSVHGNSWSRGGGGNTRFSIRWDDLDDNRFRRSGASRGLGFCVAADKNSDRGGTLKKSGVSTVVPVAYRRSAFPRRTSPALLRRLRVSERLAYGNSGALRERPPRNSGDVRLLELTS